MRQLHVIYDHPVEPHFNNKVKAFFAKHGWAYHGEGSDVGPGRMEIIFNALDNSEKEKVK